MWRLCALDFALGCVSDGEKGQWDDFWKDVRGDNMKLSNETGGKPGQRFGNEPRKEKKSCDNAAW